MGKLGPGNVALVESVWFVNVEDSAVPSVGFSYRVSSLETNPGSSNAVITHSCIRPVEATGRSLGSEASIFLIKSLPDPLTLFWMRFLSGNSIASQA